MKKFMEISIQILTKIIALLLLVLIAVITFQIVGRNFIKISTHWTEETSKYILIWLTFLGSPVVLYKGEHLIVDLFYLKFSPGVRHWVYLFSNLFIAAFTGYLTYYGYMLCTNKFVLNFTSPAANIPRVYIYSALPIGAALMVVYSLWNVWEAVMIILGKKKDTTGRSLVDESRSLEDIDSDQVEVD